MINIKIQRDQPTTHLRTGGEYSEETPEEHEHTEGGGGIEPQSLEVWHIQTNH